MFITLEGIEGSGKTTQLETVIAVVQSCGHECVATREPGGTPIGAQIRSILLDPANQALDSGAELLLYVADRVQHIRTVIQPQLAAGRVVVCDRFFDATLAYQGNGRGLHQEVILALHRMMCDDLEPDVTLLFDLAPEKGLHRAWSRIHSREGSNCESRFEQEKIDFHQRIRHGYLALARRSPKRFRMVDAGQSRELVAHAVKEIMEPLLTR